MNHEIINKGSEMKKEVSIKKVALSQILNVIFLALRTFCITRIIHSPSRIYFYLFFIILFLEMISSLFNKYFKQELLLKKEYLHNKRLIESLEKTEILYMESEYFSKKVSEFSQARDRYFLEIESLSNILTGITYVISLIILLANSIAPVYILIDIVISVIISISFIINSNRISKLMYTYWSDYIKNTRLFNKYIDVLMKKEYVIERKIFRYKSFFQEKFDQEFNRAGLINVKAGKKRLKYELFNELIYSIYLFFQISLLVWLEYSNLIDIKFFIAILPFSILTFSKLNNAFLSFSDYKHIMQYKKEFDSFIVKNMKEKLIPNKKLESLHEAVRLEDVSFSYGLNLTPIINNISLSLIKGKKYALIGENGAGKTTLIKLIAGIYKVDKGEVKANGKIRVLFQDYNKYPLSVEKNISLSEEIDSIKLRNLLDKLNIKERIDSMKYGEKTILTKIRENSEDLSKGQWQLIALARILYQDSDILILDEPTSSLDPMKEKAFYDEYLRLFVGKTILVVTHRIGFIKNFDYIIGLKDGKINEIGNHSSLLKDESSIYKKMFEKQRSMYE